jgi:hypothetical protein
MGAGKNYSPVPVNQDDGPASMALAGDKNLRRIDPFQTSNMYDECFDQPPHETIQVDYDDGSRQTFQLLKRYNDPKTSFAAASYINPADGHAVILYKGMDFPFSDQGAGTFGFLRDFGAIAKTRLGGFPEQMKQAEQVYLETLNNPQIKSLEVAGFSMGSMFVNHLAARFGAQSTVMADLGISDSAMKRDFNARARTQPENAIFANYTLGQMSQEMRRNIVSLNLDLDILPKIFAVGSRRGREIDLDPAGIDPEGIKHRVSIYRENASKLDYNRDGPRVASLVPALRPAFA